MKELKKIICKTMIILIILEIVITLISHEVKAATFWEEVFNSSDDFLEQGKEEASKDPSASDTATSEIISILYNTLLTLGVIITVAVGGVLGIKFMTASAEDKAKIKESMVPYVAGSVAIFGAFTIWRIVIKILSNV